METKTFREWEEIKGWIWTPAGDEDDLLDRPMTEQGFDTFIANDTGTGPHPVHAHGVDHYWRKRWLTENGHAHTRANLVRVASELDVQED